MGRLCSIQHTMQKKDEIDPGMCKNRGHQTEIDNADLISGSLK